MSRRGIGAALSAALVVAFLTGCTAAQPRVVADSVVRVAVDAPLTSFSGGNSTGAAVGSLTRGQFYGRDAEGELVADPSFGTATPLPGSGFDVTYSLAETATWSDGVPVSAADLLLAWAASSGALDSVLADGFDGPNTIPLADPALFPDVGEDGRSLTVYFGAEVYGWQSLLEVQVAAHELAQHALGIPDPDEANAAVIDAILEKDAASLDSLAAAWNTGDGATLSSGPYSVTESSPSLVTLVANPEYRGARQPLVETIELVTIEGEEQAIDALASGQVDIVSANTSPSVMDAVSAVPGTTVVTDTGTAIEHLDLQIEGGRSGVFSDPLAREAFLLTVPRQEIAGDAALQSSFVASQRSPTYPQTVERNGSDRYATPDPVAPAGLLAEAGLDSPEVCVLFDRNNESRAQEFQLITESAALAGFVVTDCSSDDVAGRLGKSGEYDAALFAWDESLASTRWFTELYSTGGSNNLTGYSSVVVDGLLAPLATTTDADVRAEVLDEIDRQLWADAYGVPLFAHPVVTAVSSRVTGVSNSALPSGVFWNATDWVPVADR